MRRSASSRASDSPPIPPPTIRTFIRSLLLALSCRPLQHLAQHSDILPVLRPSRRVFGANDVAQGGGMQFDTEDLEPDGVTVQVLIAFRAGRLENDIQPAGRSDQIPEIRPRQRVRAYVKRQTLGNVL